MFSLHMCVSGFVVPCHVSPAVLAARTQITPVLAGLKAHPEPGELFVYVKLLVFEPIPAAGFVGACGWVCVCVLA